MTESESYTAISRGESCESVVPGYVEECRAFRNILRKIFTRLKEGTAVEQHLSSISKKLSRARD